MRASQTSSFFLHKRSANDRELDLAAKYDKIAQWFIVDG